MNLETAQKLVAQTLPGYQVHHPAEMDGAAPRQKSGVEVISPSLQKLKMRYFGANASSTPQVLDEADDSGIVLVEKEGSSGASKAMVFSGGLLKGKQG